MMRKGLVPGILAGVIAAVALVVAMTMMSEKNEEVIGCCASEIPLGSFVLTSWSDPAELPSAQITLTIEEDQVSGVSACNNYHGPAEIAADSFSTGLMAQTMMFCEDTDEAERTYLALLDSVTTWQMDGDLVLYAGTTEVLRFARA
ncbi:MAG: META domain-containing protein [Propionibacteriaceae bacterium]|nr:META domain-containing protein [Propionibacteriaceae bacterium]